MLRRFRAAAAFLPLLPRFFVWEVLFNAERHGTTMWYWAVSPTCDDHVLHRGAFGVDAAFIAV